MKKNILEVDLSNFTWDSDCFRSKVVEAKEIIYKLTENRFSVVDPESINEAISFLSLLETSVTLKNGCSPKDSICFPAIEDPKTFVKTIVKSFLSERFSMLPDYLRVAEGLELLPSGLGLFFYGGSGRGKSTILLGLSQWLKEKNYPFVCYSPYTTRECEIFDFMDSFQEGVIIIDDVNGGYGAFFSTILDRVEKSNGKFRVFVASSLSPSEFINKYGMRCVSILKGICSFIKFEGDSLREKIVDLKF